MAKPPETPPSSDVDGVEQDRQKIDQPKNSDAKQAAHLHREEREARGRPKPSRS